jgi:hypothetical protein
VNCLGFPEIEVTNNQEGDQTEHHRGIVFIMLDHRDDKSGRKKHEYHFEPTIQCFEAFRRTPEKPECDYSGVDTRKEERPQADCAAYI